MKEIWKDIIGYEGLYSISNTGLVKRVTTNKIKYPSLNSWGYEVVSLSKPNTKLKTVLVHRLVAIHFIDNPLGRLLIFRCLDNSTSKRKIIT